MPKNNSRVQREKRKREAVTRQEEWDAMSVEERKAKVEARGYVYYPKSKDRESQSSAD